MSDGYKHSMRAGILIIGSLLWDNGKRAEWRSARLQLEQKIRVKAPICYGRMSQSRGNTFTMTFRPDATLGQAILVQCKEPAGSVDGLVAEAEALWKAEQPAASTNSIGTNWGCVGAVFGMPNTTQLIAEWRDVFRARATPVSPINADGVLQIDWPSLLDGRPVDFHVILATATKALTHRPTATEIADAWIGQNEGFEQYFFENVRNGIRTPDDQSIYRRIEYCSPRWLESEAYADVIARLREEVTEGTITK